MTDEQLSIKTSDIPAKKKESKSRKTAKKTAFARLWYQLDNKAAAYEQSYNVSPETSRQVIRNEGCLLSKDPYVISVYERLEAQEQKAALVNAHFVTNKLEEAVELGLTTTMDDKGKESAIGIGAAVSALSEINRMQGNHAAVKHQINSKQVNVVVSAGEYAQELGLSLDEIGMALKLHQEKGLDQIKAIDQVVALREPIEGEVVDEVLETDGGHNE